VTTTLAPALAKAIAQLLPIPLAAPVTIAVVLKSISIGLRSFVSIDY